MPLPSLLIIGAMRAGTTSLYMDLASHPDVFLAQDKEPESLCSDAVPTSQGIVAYNAIYARARPGQLCIDASTAYAKRPDYGDVPRRATEVLPAGFKVIYLVRHPIQRIISQHHHEHMEGKVGPSIDEEVRRHPRYIQYSRYAYQLEPWLELVGRQRLRVVQFEDYVKRRSEALRELGGFLGLDPAGFAPDEDEVYNKSQGKPVKTVLWSSLQQNYFYRNYLRWLAPLRARLAVRRVLLPKSVDRLAPPSRETLEYLKESLQDDIGRLGEMLGLETPFWSDFDDDPAVSVPRDASAT